MLCFGPVQFGQGKRERVHIAFPGGKFDELPGILFRQKLVYQFVVQVMS